MAISHLGRCAPWHLGTSAGGLPLTAWAFAPEGRLAPPKPNRAEWRWFLLLAGVHGDEVEGLWAVHEVLKGLHESHPYEHIGVVVWSEANPDGIMGNVRYNGASVDLNRNLPTKDWSPEAKNPRYPPGPSAASEPETKALVTLIDAIQPVAILSAHSFSKPQVNSNGPAREWAESVAAVCNYTVTEDIGYPTPGCLGTYAGHERGIPTITLEIERGQRPEIVVPLHTMTIATAIAFWDHP